MGQYFKALNLDKEEVVCPWCMHGGAKLWEWAVSPQGAVFTLLLRKSTAGGGGDYYGYRAGQTVDLDQPHSVASMLRTVASHEGQPVTEPDEAIVGRWAGDRVVLVGDYDESKLWDKAKMFRNISEELVNVWNNFIEIQEMKLTFNPTCSCQDDSD